MRGKSVDYNLSRSIYDFFDEQIIQNECLLNKTAIIYKSKSLTFRQVQDLITKINQFIYSSIDFEQKNCFIDVHLIPDEYTIPVLLAINSLSCGYLPIDPQLPFESNLNFI
ncbi:unnamed protein product [Brachionus calyciflorus]|uniref:AMP-dependent synthetase/ligase domain-containing protein n=1 Tax=Brachionus calyciflorus TaxID=104777 RepID=A0A814KY17_9BILA|nr:unnamed protein product [Brachionus calyciflorus]